MLDIRAGLLKVWLLVVYYHKTSSERPPLVGLRDPFHYLAIKGYRVSANLTTGKATSTSRDGTYRIQLCCHTGEMLYECGRVTQFLSFLIYKMVIV